MILQNLGIVMYILQTYVYVDMQNGEGGAIEKTFPFSPASKINKLQIFCETVYLRSVHLQQKIIKVLPN